MNNFIYAVVGQKSFNKCFTMFSSISVKSQKSMKLGLENCGSKREFVRP